MTRNGTITAQLLPAEPKTPASDKSLLERLVHEKVTEIMANREDLALRPFFDTKRVSDEIRRLQTMPERMKWAIRFERFGCLVCESKSSPHNACGMCTRCYVRTSQQLKTIVAEGMRSEMRKRFTGDLEAIAKKALRSVPALKGKE
ncbi:MAG: hypothetical protein ACRD3S_22355 [Terracidiphilus sp.]